MVFDRSWFHAHQRTLVRALHVPGLGRELRAALGVGPGRIARLLPHGYIVREPHHGYTATFWSRPLLARQLHRELRPVWQLAHWFDQHVANPYIPAFNLGFDTLTKYPDADPETTSVDGYVGRFGVDESFATIVAGVGTGGLGDADASAFVYLRGSSTSNQFDQLRRAFLLFDTSSLGAGATISAATLSLWGVAKDNALGASDLAVVATNPASNTSLTDSDFQTAGSTSFGSVTYAGFDGTNSTYTDITINATGRAAIEKTGITKYGARLEWDRAASFGGAWVASAVSFFQINMAENASGTARAPKLVVTYTPGLEVRVYEKIAVQTTFVG